MFLAQASGSRKLPPAPNISSLEVPMPLSLATLSLVASPLSVPEGLKILERDDYRCQYCGLDGRGNFDEAKAFVLKHREELRKAWESKTARQTFKPANA